MKKTLFLLALLCAMAPGAWAQATWQAIYAMTGTSSSNWTAINAGSTTGYTLGSAGNRGGVGGFPTTSPLTLKKITPT